MRRHTLPCVLSSFGSTLNLFISTYRGRRTEVYNKEYFSRLHPLRHLPIYKEPLWSVIAKPYQAIIHSTLHHGSRLQDIDGLSIGVQETILVWFLIEPTHTLFIQSLKPLFPVFSTLCGKLGFLALALPILRSDIGSSHNFFLKTTLLISFGIDIVKR